MRTKKVLANIESLRFLAVLVVVLYHLHVPGFSLGYLGVDIFFVISGFVISRSIQSNTDKGKFSLVNFWVRRANRLLPALYVVLISVLVFSLVFDPPHITKNIGQAATATVLYIANIFYYFEIDYFNNFHNNSPLLHTWSLSLEEQFYFLLPLVMLFYKKIRKPLFIAVIALLSVVSLTSWIITSSTDLLAAFYFPWNRFWQLFIGVILGIGVTLKSDKRISILSFVGLVLAIVFSPDEIVAMPFVMVLTTIMLVFSNTEDLFIHRKLFMWGGKYSYSIYLWHQPLIYYLLQYPMMENEVLNGVSIFLLSIVFSLGSYHLVENPLRYGKSYTKFAGLAGVSIFIVGCGFLFHKKNGLLEFKSGLWNIDNVVSDRDDVFNERLDVWNDILHNATSADSSLLILGDSKAEDLTVTLSLYGPETRYNFVKTQTWEYNADFINSNPILRKALENDSLQAIVLTNTWKSVDNQGTLEFIQYLETHYAVPIIMFSTANFEDVSSLAFNLYRQGYSVDEMKKEFYANIRFDWKKQSDELHQSLVDRGSRVIWYDKINAFCDREDQACELILEDGTMVIYDTGHLSVRGAKLFSDWLISIPELNTVFTTKPPIQHEHSIR